MREFDRSASNIGQEGDQKTEKSVHENARHELNENWDQYDHGKKTARQLLKSCAHIYDQLFEN